MLAMGSRSAGAKTENHSSYRSGPLAGAPGAIKAARFYALPLQKKLEVKPDKHNVGYLPDEERYSAHLHRTTVTKPSLNEAFSLARDMPSDHPGVVADRRFRSPNELTAASGTDCTR